MEHFRVERCDFRNVGGADVDLIVTDPPYGREFDDIWYHLGRKAREWLRPGGLLITYASHTTFPEAFDGLRAHLNYYWIGSVDISSNPNYFDKKYNMRSGSRPILMFTNGKYTPRARTDDTFKSPAPDKRFHKWQQNLEPIKAIIEQYSEPGDFVMDPMMGSGTTAVACVELGRQFFGCDEDAHAISIAASRLTLTLAS